MVCADRLAVRAMRRFAEEYRAKGCPIPDESKVKSRKSKVNEPWRRITGITEDIEHCMDPKERRAGIRDLVKWIEEFTIDDLRMTIAGKGIATAGVMMRSGVAGVPLVAATSIPTGPRGQATQAVDPGETADGAMAFGDRAARLADARGSEETWACEGQAREVVVRVCAALNISRHKLSELTREYRGISATELIDGFRVKKIKSALAERVKRFAKELWLSPGNYVGVLVADSRLKLYGGGASEYFVDPSEEFYRKELAETREERMEALIHLFDSGWKRCGDSRDGFAVSVGFRSFSELNRACLNVWGVSARQVANEVCGDVIDYYLAREQEELRVLACCERVTPGVARARYLYTGGSKAPEGDLARVGFLWDVMGEEARVRMTGWMDTA